LRVPDVSNASPSWMEALATCVAALPCIPASNAPRAAAPLQVDGPESSLDGTALLDSHLPSSPQREVADELMAQMYFEHDDSHEGSSGATYFTNISFKPGADLTAVVDACRDGEAGVIARLDGNGAMIKLLALSFWKPASKGTCKCSDVLQYQPLAATLSSPPGTLEATGVHYKHRGNGCDELEMYAFVVDGKHLLIVKHGKLDDARQA